MYYMGSWVLLHKSRHYSKVLYLALFSLHTNGRRGTAHAVTPKIFVGKVPFLAFLLPDMNTAKDMAIYIYLNIPQMSLIPNI